MLVKDLMTRDAISCRPENNLAELAEVMPSSDAEHYRLWIAQEESRASLQIGILLPFFWLPADNMDRPQQETAAYRRWADQGLITLTEGNVVDFSAVRKKLMELRDQADLNIQQIAFDPWNAQQLAQQLTEDGFQMIEVSQTYRHLSEPTKELQSAVVDGKLRHGGHPVLRWMADCMTVKQDVNGNVRPVKPERLKSSKRIDGMVALIMAMSRAMTDDSPPSIYNYQGLRWVKT